MNARKNIPDLINDSMFMPLEQYRSKEVQERIQDQEQYKKTTQEMLRKVLHEKIKRTK
jgi:hypothetical protein